jgi:drug/metabolite transporter (DMT)-like permease
MNMKSVLTRYIALALVAGGASAFSSPPASFTRPALATHSDVLQKNNNVAALFVSGSETTEERVVRDVAMTEMETPPQNQSQTLAYETQSSNLSPPSWFEPLAWRSVIMVLCVLWASNFATAKLVMAEPGVDSALYAVSRFSVAALVLAPGAISAARKSNLDWETSKAAAICGGWVALGYIGQTLGLLTTTASRSCVICSLHCVFVATIAEIWRVQRSSVETAFDTKRLLPAILAVIGVAIVELKGAGGAPTIGDALSFAQPIGFGMGYLQLEEIMSKKPEAALPVSAIKLAVVAIASLGLFEISPLLNNFQAADFHFMLRLPDFGAIVASETARMGILYTGLVTTALALWVESKVFAKVPATDASIILTTEPLIAAGFGAVALGETFGMSDYVGASLIVGACVTATLLDTPGSGEEEAECAAGIGLDDDRAAQSARSTTPSGGK